MGIKDEHCGFYDNPDRNSAQNLMLNKHRNIWENVYDHKFKPDKGGCMPGYMKSNGYCYIKKYKNDDTSDNTNNCRSDFVHSINLNDEINKATNPKRDKFYMTISAAGNTYQKKLSGTRLGKKKYINDLPKCPDGYHESNKLKIIGSYGQNNKYKEYARKCISNKPNVKPKYMYSTHAGMVNDLKNTRIGRKQNKKKTRDYTYDDIPDCPSGYKSGRVTRTKYGPNNQYRTYAKKCTKKLESFNTHDLNVENGYEHFDRYDMYRF